MATGPSDPSGNADDEEEFPRRQYFDVMKAVYLVGETPLRVFTARPGEGAGKYVPFRYILCCN